MNGGICHQLLEQYVSICCVLYLQCCMFFAIWRVSFVVASDNLLLMLSKDE